MARTKLCACKLRGAMSLYSWYLCVMMQNLNNPTYRVFNTKAVSYNSSYVHLDFFIAKCTVLKLNISSFV